MTSIGAYLLLYICNTSELVVEYERSIAEEQKTVRLLTLDQQEKNNALLQTVRNVLLCNDMQQFQLNASQNEIMRLTNIMDKSLLRYLVDPSYQAKKKQHLANRRALENKRIKV